MTQTNDVERRLLVSACTGTDITPDLIETLIDLERDNERRLRRRGLFAALRGCIENYSKEQSDDYHQDITEKR